MSILLTIAPLNWALCHFNIISQTYFWVLLEFIILCVFVICIFYDVLPLSYACCHFGANDHVRKCKIGELIILNWLIIIITPTVNAIILIFNYSKLFPNWNLLTLFKIFDFCREQKLAKATGPWKIILVKFSFDYHIVCWPSQPYHFILYLIDFFWYFGFVLVSKSKLTSFIVASHKNSSVCFKNWIFWSSITHGAREHIQLLGFIVYFLFYQT